MGMQINSAVFHKAHRLSPAHRFEMRALGSKARAFSRILMIAAATLPLCSAQQAADGTAWLQFIGQELRQLRVELLDQSMAEETGRLTQIERDLVALRLEQSKHQGEERLQKQQMADLESQAGDPTDTNTQAQIQAAKGELTSISELTRVVQSSLNVRERELNERLRAARARLQSISGRLKALSVPQP